MNAIAREAKGLDRWIPEVQKEDKRMWPYREGGGTATWTTWLPVGAKPYKPVWYRSRRRAARVARRKAEQWEHQAVVDLTVELAEKGC